MHKMSTAFTYTRNRTGPSMYLQYTPLLNAVHESVKNIQNNKENELPQTYMTVMNKDK